LGRRLDERACAELSGLPDVDPCGERGEYHTLVVDGPHFAHPLAVLPGTVREEGRFLLQDLALAPAPQAHHALGMGE
jgi:diphthamide synthase (EF-2-diphthine--ammonia ligase)